MNRPYDSELMLCNALLQKWQIKKFSYRNVLRPDYGFLYLLSGEIVYSDSQGETRLSKGDIAYLPKNSKYEAFFNIDKGKIVSLLLNFEILRGDAPFSEVRPTVIFNDSAEALNNLFEQTVRLYNNGGSPFLTKSAFNLCIHSLLNAAEASCFDSKELRLKQVANMLSNDPRLRIAEAARLSDMSPSAFQKHFKAYFGVAPTEYRNKKRLDKSRLLLETTDMPIKEIAYSLGFYDVSQFYKIFGAEFHTTPKMHREAHFREYNRY